MTQSNFYTTGALSPARTPSWQGRVAYLSLPCLAVWLSVGGTALVAPHPLGAIAQPDAPWGHIGVSRRVRPVEDR
jgi:hypothetical protein